MPNLLIAGVGWLGGALARRAPALLGPGWRIWGLCRSPARLPPGVVPWAADLTAGPLGAPPARFAAAVIAVAPGRADAAAYEALYVGGTAALAAALLRAGQRPRTLYVSSTGVFGEEQGGWVDESSPADAEGWRGRALRGGEAAARALPTCVLRLAGLYGPGRDGPLARLRAGTASWPAPPRWSNRIHLDDAVGLLAHLLLHPDPPATLIGVDAHPSPSDEVLAFLAARAGLPVRGRRPAGGQLPAGKRCRSLLRAELGYRLQVPSYREGFAALLAGSR